MRIKLINFLIVPVFILTFTVGCEKSINEKPEAEDDLNQVVATIDEHPIRLFELYNEGGSEEWLGVIGKSADQERVKKLREAFLSRLIRDRILEIEADRQKIEVTSDELANEMFSMLGDYDESRLKLKLAKNKLKLDDWKRLLKRRIKIEKLLDKHFSDSIKVEDDELRSYYKANKSSFKVAEKRHLYQIMSADETLVSKIRKELAAGADFNKIARERSASPDRAKGGDMGYFSRGQLPLELEEVAFKLKIGLMSEVVESEYGFHILKVVDREAAKTLKYEEVKDKIYDIIIEGKREDEYKRWISELEKGHKVVVHRALLLP